MGWKAKGICIPNVGNCDETLPQINTGEFGTWAAPAFNGSDNPVSSFNEDLMWTRGKHTFKAGTCTSLRLTRAAGTAVHRW